MEKVLMILGPTAVGKTTLSIHLAQALQGEIISGDSMQVYRHLNIGTAKVTNQEMMGVPHHLIDIKDVNERYSVAEFVNRAQGLIDDIVSRGHFPIVVGGTGFYAKALLYDMMLGGDAYDQGETVRKKWHQFELDKGPRALWEALQQVDAKAAAAIPEGNVRRVIRALEVIERTGGLFSEQQRELKPRFDAKIIGLNTDRAVLYKRINARVDEMFSAGLLEEARWLNDRDGFQFQAGKGIGYREFIPYFEKRRSLEEVADAIKQDTRHYAKRQLTWLRHQLPVVWFDLVRQPTGLETVQKAVDSWLNPM